MTVAITGAGGLVGSALCHRLSAESIDLIRLVRTAPTQPNEVLWNPVTGEADLASLEGIDAVVHLAGENIAKGRWRAAKKDRIFNSRVGGTESLCQILAKLQRPPQVLVSASAIGYYGNRGEEILTEKSTPGTGFLSEVCQQWESATAAAAEAGIRVVHTRIGVVLSKEGGALASMLMPFRFGLGGRVGSGQQYWSWIAMDDLTQVLWTCVSQPTISGPINAVSPEPLTNLQFTKTLGRSLHRPTVLPLPAFAVRCLMGEMGEELLLSSTRVVPAALERLGFSFRYSDLTSALASILDRR